MPEIVEVEIQMEGLREAIVGDKIIGVNFFDRGEKIIRPTSSAVFTKSIINKEVLAVTRVGKYIVFWLDRVLMTSHLAMTGRWLLDVPETEIGHSRIQLRLASGRILRYSDVRLFGRIRLEHDLKNKIYNKGLDVLKASKEDIEATLRVYRAKKGSVPIKKVLSDQKVLCGLGNVYANEILWENSCYPGKPLGKFSDEDIHRLAVDIRNVLAEGYKLGGLSLKDYYHVDGTKGEMQDNLNVYQRESCDVCSSIADAVPIYKSEDFDGRATYYCPSCQIQKS